MEKTKSAVAEALLILRKGGQGAEPEKLFTLSKQLKNEKAFSYARRILELARKLPAVPHSLGLKLDQQCALCIYKDQNLPLVERLNSALKILEEGRSNLLNTNNQETLGIAGAIYKRKWEADGQKQHLERSLAYYKRGYQQGIINDMGYTALNAAFMLDLLAHQDSLEAQKAGADSPSADLHRTQSKSIRQELIDQLLLHFNNLRKDQQTELETDYWFSVTLAEAYFGLGEYTEAVPWLDKAANLNTPEWQLETTTRQLAHLAMLHEKKTAGEMQETTAWQVLLDFTNIKAAALQTLFAGKVGLALSGGGFRASLYHIGVLAQLAEQDMLRHIEVLSCVSGGSIIGAHYYLEVRHLLQTKKDSEITGEDYINIVERITRDFLAGVQRNIRTRVASNFFINLKMLFTKHYSRTNRAGELYEEEIYAKVKDGQGNKERYMHDLFIYPLGEDGKPIIDFNPTFNNWRRKHKIPILVLNATTLNTGHNWQFTASWMGEPPASIQKVDGNYRLRRMYYKIDGVAQEKRKIRLGEAVAASACVPGLFEPLALPDLYPDKTVRLVDGGVHDNQGICSLLEQDCSVLLVSDASGQMGTIDDPSSGILGVPLRANDILMERVRNAQFQDLENRLRSGILKGKMFIHLKMGLDVEAIDWVDCEDPSDETSNIVSKASLTAYEVRKDLQKQLAAIRTDLDSFNDTEAHALMASGYLACKYEYSKSITGFPQSLSTTSAWDWPFLTITKELQRPDTNKELVKLLEVAKERMFKVWRLSATLKVLAYVLVGLAGAGFILAVVHWYTKTLVKIDVSDIAWFVAFTLLSLLLGKTIIRIIRYRKTLTQVATGVGLATFGFIAANLHLWIFDKLYLHKGKRPSIKLDLSNSPKSNTNMNNDPSLKEVESSNI